MPIDLERMIRNINPDRTVLFFGAGSSIPSGSPSATVLKDGIAKNFNLEAGDFNLSEIAELAEIETDRANLIEYLRSQFPKPNPTGGLLNIPLFDWKSIFTTNYDELLERTFHIRGRPAHVVTTNYDFSERHAADSQPIFKIHGTINKDVSDGSRSRIIITQGDYDKTREYREFLFDRLSADMAGASLVIIGYSLSDRDIRDVIDRALSIQAKLDGSGGEIYLLMYQRDEGRAKLFEARGVRVAFGGIDQFSEALARSGPATSQVYSTDDDPVQASKSLSPTAIDVSHSLTAFSANASAMFNGWPATYADIKNDMTFQRTASNSITASLEKSVHQHAVIAGASGVGKTTAARQIIANLENSGWRAWEHKSDFDFPPQEWLSVAEKLAAKGSKGVLLIDDAHFHLPDVNRLVDDLESKGLTSLSLVLTVARSQWQVRTKAIALTKHGVETTLSKLNSQEIDRLIMLVTGNQKIKPLVHGTFSGFSFQEKRTRLQSKCEADAFVCLRNIFATESFDDIILREYADLQPAGQDIYKLVAMMEHAGVRVHRQLVMRLTNISADRVGEALSYLSDVISEYDISERIGIYGWKVRHEVIAGIIAKYKFADFGERLQLFDRIIDNLSPSYEIERRTLNEICNIETGIPSIGDKQVQNRLLRKIISIAPGERIPRHRLIRNLIDSENFDLAQTEIRVFKHDLGVDGPVARYESSLLLARALYTPGLMDEDRLVILDEAAGKARTAAERFVNSRQVHSIFCEIGLEILIRSGDSAIYDEAIKGLKSAERRSGDDLVTRAIRNFERRRLTIH